jgi:Ser-tRNA(Ala) deacylase AlaX
MLDAQTQIKVQLNQSLVDIKTKEEEDEIRRQIAKLVERSVKDNEVINVSEMSDKEKEVYAKQILKQAETNTYRPSALIDDGIIVF